MDGKKPKSTFNVSKISRRDPVKKNMAKLERDLFAEIMQGFEDLQLDRSLYQPEQEDKKEDT